MDTNPVAGDVRVTPDDLPALPQADVLVGADVDPGVGVTATSARRGYTIPNTTMFSAFNEFPDSGNPTDYPNGYVRL